MFVNGSGRNEQSLQRTFHRCFLPSFVSFGQVVSEKILKNRPMVRVEGTTNLLFPHTQSISIYPGTISDVLKIYSTELVLFNILSLLYTRIFLSRTTYLYYPNEYILVSTNISLLSTQIYFLSQPTYLYYPNGYMYICVDLKDTLIVTSACLYN